MKEEKQKRPPFSLHRYALMMTLIWTGSIIISIAWNLGEINNHTIEAARIQARVAFEKEIVYRRWNAGHGVVYVEVNDQTPPNPYLANIPERDITTPLGKTLTMMNPAYMTRQANRLAEKEFGIRSRITSLHLINPSNAPDLWERQALLAFQQGVEEVSAVETLEGREFMRFMRPLEAEKSCLPCHDPLDERKGAVLGGISVAVPMNPLRLNAYRHMFNLAVGHGLLWLLGLAGIKLGAGRLIKNQKEREEMLETIRKLSFAIEQNPSSMVIADTAGNIDYVNPAFTKALGYTLEEIRGKKLSFLDSGVHPPQFYRAMWDAIKAGQTWRGDICNRKKDGSLFWELLSVSPIRNEEGKITNFISVAIDDTERKRAEDALWKSEEKFRSISASAKDAIIMKDNDGRISFWNKAAEQIFGYSEGEVLGKNLHLLLSPVRYHGVNISAFENFKKTGTGNLVGQTVEVAALRKDGTEFPIELSVSAVRLDDKWSAIGIIRDITARKKVEAELKAAKELAEEANRAKSEFLATMSHELRTPLNAIIGFSKVLLGGMSGELTQVQTKDIGHILSGGNQLLDLVNDILDISKIEAGRLTVEALPFSLRDVIDNIVTITTQLGGPKRIDVAVDYDEGLPINMMGDPARVRQIVLNFAANAVKFTDHGQIVIKAACTGKKDDDMKVKISVEDTGIGIPEEKLDKVFEKFTQADSSTTRKYGGTGLGLTISKKLAEFMGGSVGVSSKVGAGSLFWTELPMKLIPPRQAPQKTAAEPAPPKTFSGTRVLVVDDNVPNQEIAEKMLRAAGCRVDIAEDGKAAVRKVEATSYDLILMDCQMPEMDGYEAARRIRKGRSVPIVAMTAKVMRDDRTRCLAAGMDDYIKKPLSMDILYKVLNRWVKGGKA